MNVVISISPVSQLLQQQLRNRYSNKVRFLTVAELRKLPLLKMLQLLRKLNAKEVIAVVEDSASLATQPILVAITGFAKANSKYLIQLDQRQLPLNWRDVIASLIRTMLASIINVWIAVKSHWQLKRCQKEPFTIAAINKTEKCYFINANLWFGIQAGGSVGHIAGVVNGLQAHGCEIIYGAISPNVMIAEPIVHTALRSPKSFGIPSELNYYNFSQQVVRQLQPAIKAFKPDFIYQRLSLGNYSGVMLARKTGIPLVLEYNGSEVWCAEKWGGEGSLRYAGLAKLAENVCLQNASYIVTISTVLKEELIKRGIAEQKIICYPNCIDPSVFNPARFDQQTIVQLRNRYRIAPESIVLTFIGTFGAWHGVEVLAQAIRKLIDTRLEWLREHRLHFLLVGDGHKMSEVRSILSKEQDSCFVTLAGLIPQVEAPIHLAASDILLSPHVPNPDSSRFFGSPTKLFEYMVMGKAIIASRLEQIADVLSPGLAADALPIMMPDADSAELAVLCEPGSVGHIIQAIQFLVSQPQWREVLGISARRKALAQYTWHHHTKAILKKLTNQAN